MTTVVAHSRIVIDELAGPIAEVLAEDAIPGAESRTAVLVEALDLVRASGWGAVIAALDAAELIALADELEAPLQALDPDLAGILLTHLRVLHDLYARPVDRVRHLIGDAFRGHLLESVEARGPITVGEADAFGSRRVSGDLVGVRPWEVYDTLVLYREGLPVLAVPTFRAGVLADPAADPRTVRLTDVLVPAVDQLVPVAWAGTTDQEVSS